MKDTLDVFDFFKKFPDEKSCEEFIIKARWPRGMYCPHCGNYKLYRLEKQKRFKCAACRKQFSVRTGSILAESKITLQQWIMATWLLTTHRKGFSSIQLAKTLGVTQKTAWFLAHRIRETFKEKGGLFDGTVEVDETYVGGKEKNKHNNKKLNAGRGGVGKTIVIGIKERGGRVKAKSIKDTTALTLQGEIRKNVYQGAIVFTDEHKAYKGLLDYKHEAVKHSVGEYVNGMVSTNGIESFWALLKRGFYGIYHQMSEKHLDRYVNEFCFRQNTKDDSDEATFARAFYNGNGRRLTYRRLTKIEPINATFEKVMKVLLNSPKEQPQRTKTKSLSEWTGKAHCMDCIKLMETMPAESISVIVTSPPYNIKNSTGNGLKNGSGGKWPKAALLKGYQDYTDNMPHAQYVAWQRKCLDAMIRILKPNGAIFYNHKWRVQNGLLQDRAEIVSGFPVRQVIIWRRKGGINFNPGYFLPTYEVIYLIAKPDFKLAPKANAQGDVWDIPQARDNKHPAPFPIELAQRCIASTIGGVVFDPFMGSGTTALAAEVLNREWIGAEISEKYCKMIEKRLKDYEKTRLT